MTAALAPAAPLDLADWQARRRAHEERVDGWLAPHLARRRTGAKHPVEDFLFTYYSHRPAQLRRWHPGPGAVLRGADGAEFGPDYRATAAGLTLDTEGVRARRAGSVDWIRALLAATADRPAHLGCFGMHEWAMVYRQTQEEVRHNAWPLRLSPAETAAVVEERGVRCSHFDAYRFFTAPARPLNLLAPTRESQHDLEQPGCLHANMDLYKWAYKLSPLVCSELVADGFALAREIRALDMRASPYDLAALGYPPVRVETPEGRAEYAAAQRGFAERAAVLRARLLDALGRAEGPLPAPAVRQGPLR
ncbi:3-methyladenine DNA glycosylase [Micromonospora sp. NBC_01655]|uniref:3-methyladenine DNA glycosylase n=1 Tax=Micromonospora sp. NBC_01655 TaxID=2975983 RepID=UPI0022595DB6|nr:3-methyladenine DNA glycosylase [Micromonospora sp. NBC_01655]MCX4473977.1 3-methyladenine DNA glycosylase [Micromonospora sp. NBC_01655]